MEIQDPRVISIAVFVFALTLIVINIAILIFGIFYFTKKLPSFIQKGINFIKKFEVSRNVTAIVLVGLVFGYIGFSFQELPVEEGKTYGDFERVKAVVEAWPFGNVVGEESLFNLHVKNFLLTSSQFLFQNYRVMPF